MRQLISMTIVATTAAMLAGTLPAGAAPCTPLRTVILQDQTGSVQWTRTPALRFEDLQPLFAVLAECSGEIGIGLVRDRSNAGLARLVFASARPEEIQEPKWSSNPFVANQEKARMQPQVEARKKERAQWERDAQARLQEFRTLVDPLLKSQGRATRSDVNSALRRADAFLSEDPLAWPGRPRLFAIVVSDGQDNVRGAAPTWRSKAQILAVHSDNSLGVLENIQPQPIRFESIGAAIRHLAALARR